MIVRVDEEIAAAESGAVGELLDRYRQSLTLERRMLLDRFSLMDVARKVVGVGSVGTRCLIVLLEAGDGTPLFLQLKQADVIRSRSPPSGPAPSSRQVNVLSKASA